MTHNLHFLLTDDDEDDRFLFQEALQSVDPSIQCQTAKNGREALIFLKETNRKLPDVIFLDINMPEVNGWEFLNKVKKSSTLSSIPITIYSTSSQKVDIEKAKELGAFGFCTKPDVMDELKQILKYIAEGLKKGFGPDLTNSGIPNFILFNT
jgi:CheY-like chemotaxis protein